MGRKIGLEELQKLAKEDKSELSRLYREAGIHPDEPIMHRYWDREISQGRVPRRLAEHLGISK